jgi:hypothetical protein
MKAKDLFTIILKVFGIYLIKDVLVSIPPVLDIFYKFFQFSADVAVFSLFVSLLTFALYFGIVYILILKTNWLISKLQLTSNLSDEPLVINLHRSSVYTIAIIVSGIVILAFAIPQLVREFYAWYKYIDSRKGIFGAEYFDHSGLLKTMAEVIIGLLFLGNQKTLVNFIESRRRESKGN